MNRPRPRVLQCLVAPSPGAPVPPPRLESARGADGLPRRPDRGAPWLRAATTALALCLLTTVGTAQLSGEVAGQQKLGPFDGFSGAVLCNADRLGGAVANVGDVNGDGVVDLALGMPGDNGQGAPDFADRGALWVAFMRADGGLSGRRLVADELGGFGPGLDDGDEFGAALAGLGDLDGDGVPDVAVGAPGDDDGGVDQGALWVLLLEVDGSVKSRSKISATAGGPAFPALAPGDGFGTALTAVGDVNGDGVVDLVVGAPGDDVAAAGAGAVHLLFLDAGGGVVAAQRITAGEGGFVGPLGSGARFGSSAAELGDVDGNGTGEVAVGAVGDGVTDTGAVWVLSLDVFGNVVDEHRIAAGEGGFGGALAAGDRFGAALAATGDLSGDGFTELAVGAPGDGTSGPGRSGAVWVALLAADAQVKSEVKIAAGQGGFDGSQTIATGNPLEFGAALAPLGDLDGDQVVDLVIGTPWDEFLLGPQTQLGAAWVVFMEGVPPQTPYSPPNVGGPIPGRAGRSALVLPPALPDDGSTPDDLIEEPIVVTPRNDGGSLTTQGISALAGGELAVTLTGEFSTGVNPSMAATADFDGDGAPDVVAANQGSDSFTALIGNPDQGPIFESMGETAVQDSEPLAIVAGTLGAAGAAGVALVAEKGVSTFSFDPGAPTSFSFSSFTAVDDGLDLDLGDVTGDGLADIVTATGAVAVGGVESGAAVVLQGEPGGGFTEIGSFAEGHAVASVRLSDWNNDGNLDALIAVHEATGGPVGEPQGLVQLHLGDGAGGFQLSAEVAFPSRDGTHPTFADVEDVNRDGFVDAVFTQSDNRAFPVDAFADEQPPIAVVVLINDQAGGFLQESVIATAYVGKGVTPLLGNVVDFQDGAGTVDLVVVFYNDTSAGGGMPSGGGTTFQSFVVVLQGDGMGNFVDPNPIPAGDGPGNGDVGELGEVGADGGGAGNAPDLLFPDGPGNQVIVLLGNGDGTFRDDVPPVPNVDELDAEQLGPDWVGGPRALRLDALDDDGISDLVVLNQWDEVVPGPPGLVGAGSQQVLASLTLFLGAGEGEFVRTQYVPLEQSGEFALGDVTGDGLTDVVVTQRIGAGGARVVLVFPGDGTGRVGDPTELRLPLSKQLSGGLALSDVDDDGDLDVITSCTFQSGFLALGDGGADGALAVFENEGDGFVVRTFVMGAAWSEVRSLELADADGDAAPDVFMGELEGRLFVALADGSGGFEPAVLDGVSADVGGGALGVGDLNGDGLTDVVSVQDATNGELDQAFVRTLLAQGEGRFAVGQVPGLQATGLSGSLRPLLADLDDDGANDIVLVHGDAGSVSVLLNELNTFEEFGPGKPGSGGFVPRIAGRGYTTLGGRVEIEISDVLGGATALLCVGIGRADLPEEPYLAIGSLAFDSSLQVSGPKGVPGAGGLTFDGTVRDVPGFLGVEIVLQVVVFDPGADTLPGPPGLALSNGLSVTIVQ